MQFQQKCVFLSEMLLNVDCVYLQTPAAARLANAMHVRRLSTRGRANARALVG